MKKLLFLFMVLTSTMGYSQSISQHFSSTVPTGWSSTSSTWILNYDGSATGNYRSIYDATKYSARFPSAATGNSTYLYIPITFIQDNLYTITFYTKRACNITLLVNETANQLTPLSTQTIDNASCNSNFSTWYSWSFSYTATYSGSGYIEILINTVYGGPTSVYLDDFDVAESNALPIELVYFKGKSYGGYNKLNWYTASENNNDYFTIEKTVDGVYYYNLCKIKGAGESRFGLSYEYLDRDISDGISYYVLRQTDYDGKYKRSDIISIDNRDKATPLLIKVTNLLGQEVTNEYKGILLFIYSDGTIIKRIF